MDTAGRGYFPPGEIRVSDAERDRALAELSEALQAGRITAGEYDQRSGQALAARTGNELAVPLADLPPDQAPTAHSTAMERAQRLPATRLVFGASVAAVCFAGVALNAALSTGPTLQQRQFAQQMAELMTGRSFPLPPAPGFNVAGTLVPAIIAVMLVALVVFLRVNHRADRL
jgi:hypothetical protein